MRMRLSQRVVSRLSALRLVALLGVLVASCSWPPSVIAQQSVVQGGATTQGHAPAYITGGTGQPMVIDSGPAGGNTTGQGLSELNITARGTGTAPYVGQGTGPDGTIACLQDAVASNATGYHYLCFSANALNGGLIEYGAGGTASTLPLNFKINGTVYPFPGTGTGNVVGPATSTVGDMACFNNLVGTLLQDCGKPLTGPGTSTVGDVVTWGNSSGTALKDAGGPPFLTVNTNAALVAVSNPNSGQIVERIGYYAAGDGGAGTYRFSSSACSLNGGTGDGGSQVASVGGGCWLLVTTSAPVNAGAFGFMCDGATNKSSNNVITRIVAWINANSGFVQLPAGDCRYGTVWPSITSTGGGLIGQGDGCGNGPNVTGPSLGTTLRFTGTSGNEITLSGAFGFKLSDVCIWPVNHKTSGYGLAVTLATQTLVQNVTFWYPFRAILDQGNTYPQFEGISIFDNFDTAWIYVNGGTGVSLSGGGGSEYRRCYGYSTDPSGIGNLPQAGAVYVTTTYPAGVATSFATGAFVYASSAGAVLVATTGGTTSGTGGGPTLPTYTLSNDPSTVGIVDGSVTWKWYANPTSAYFVADSGTIALQISDCWVTQTGRFLMTQNTLTSAVPPKQIQIAREIGNSFWNEAILDQSGWGMSLLDNSIQNSVTGPVVSFTSATQGMQKITGGYYFGAPGSTISLANNAGASGGNGAMLTGAIVCGAGLVTPGSALEIANAGTRVSGGSYGQCAVGASTKDKYGIQIDSTATNYGVLDANVQGSTSSFNNLSTHDGEGVPISWTPALKLGGGSTAMTYSAQVGTYVRIGKRVQADFNFTLTALGSSTGAATIANLPLAASSTQIGTAAIGQYTSLAAGVTSMSGIVPTGAGAITLYKTGAGTAAAMADTDFTNTSALVGSASYFIP